MRAWNAVLNLLTTDAAALKNLRMDTTISLILQRKNTNGIYYLREPAMEKNSRDET
jgi:hypothetical protein